MLVSALVVVWCSTVVVCCSTVVVLIVYRTFFGLRSRLVGCLLCFLGCRLGLFEVVFLYTVASAVGWVVQV